MFDQRLPPCFIGIHAQAKVVLDMRLQMAFYLLDEFTPLLRVAEQAGKS